MDDVVFVHSINFFFFIVDYKICNLFNAVNIVEMNSSALNSFCPLIGYYLTNFRSQCLINEQRMVSRFDIKSGMETFCNIINKLLSGWFHLIAVEKE